MELRRPKKRAVPQSAEGDGGSYYAAMSRRTAIVKWALVVAIPVFLVVMLGVYRSNITYDNLTYLLRDFRADRDGASSEFTDVTFENQSTLDAALFRGELAVVGSSNVSLYNGAGSKTFDYRSGMSDPVCVTTDKYMLAYDLGGTKYSIYSNLTRVLDAEEDAVIENASMAQNGAFLITKRARDAKYVVALYGTDFQLAANYKRPRFVSDAAISPDGERIVIVTVANSGAALSTKVEMYDFAGTEPVASFDGTGFLPIRISYFENGAFALVCDTRIIFFDKNCSVVTTYYPDDGRIACSAASSTELCAAYSGSAIGFSTDVLIFDNAGNILYNIKTDQKLADVSFTGDFVYALGAGGAFRFSRADKNVARADCDADALRIVAADGFAVVVSASSAKSVFASASAPTAETGE